MALAHPMTRGRKAAGGDRLGKTGVMDAALLYESPFTDLTPQGPNGIFTSVQVDALVAILEHIRDTAVAA